VPTGHDRLAYKAEEHIKGISGVPDSAQGMDRADVAAKAIQQKKLSSKTNLVKPMDSLVRTDFIIARNTLDLVQEFMSEERIMTITKDSITGETEDFTVNQMDPATGEVLNDLTIGEFSLVVSSTPQRETLEDNEFDQLVEMRKEIGVKIPDHVIVNASRLRNKGEIIKSMEGDKNSPEGKRQAELQARGEEAAVSKEEGEAKAKHADATLRGAKAEQIAVESHIALNGGGETPGTPGLDVEDAARKHDREDEVASAKIAAIQDKSNLERDTKAEELRIKAQAEADKAATDRVQRMTQPEPQGAE
jgi:hypothetical protein